MNMIKKLFDIRPDEWPRFSLFFAAFFIYNVGVSWSSSSVAAIILNELGANFVAQGLVFFGLTTIVASVIYTAFVDRIPKHMLLVIMTAISAFLVGSVFLLLILGARTFAAIGLFVLSEAILLIWTLQWKTNIIDFYDTRTSKRILPLLGVGRLVGLSFGGFSYPFLTDTLKLNADQIVLMWFITLVIVLFIIWVMPRVMKDAPLQWENVDEGYLDSIKDGFSFITNSSYLKWMAISAILMNAMISLFQFKAGVLVEDYYRSVFTDSVLREAAIGNFYALVGAYSSLVMLFVQLFLFPRIMNRLGLGNVNLIYPIASFFVAISLGVASLGLVSPATFLLIAGAADIDRNSFRRVFRSPINGLLINAVPSFMKGRSRSVINGIIAPIAVIIIGFTSQIESNILFAVVVVVIAGAYMYTGFVLKKQYAEAMVQLLASEDYATLLSQDNDFGQADSDVLQMLAKRLDNEKDEEIKLFLATIIAEIGGLDAEPTLIELLPKLSNASKSRLLTIMLDSEAMTRHSRSVLVNYSNSDDAQLKRTALRALLHVILPTDSVFNRLTSEYLHDPDYVIRLDMAEAMARHASDDHQKEQALRVMRASMNDYDVQVRSYAVIKFMNLGDPAAIEHLALLLDDDNDEVRYEVTRAIDHLWRDNMPEDLKQMIYDREPLLLDDPIPRIRQAELALLRHFKDDRARTSLVRGLDDPNKEIRYTALDALILLRKQALPVLQPLLESDNLIRRKMATVALAKIQPDKYRDKVHLEVRDNAMMIYHNHDTIALMELARGKPSFLILESYYEQQNMQLLDELFWMLEYITGKDIAVIRETIASDNNRTRMNAIEALESKINPEIARLIAPLFDKKNTSVDLSALYRDLVADTRTPQDVLLGLSQSNDSWLRVMAVSFVADLGMGNTELIEKIHGLDVTLPKKPVRELADNRISTSVLYKILQQGLDDADADVVIASQSASRQITGRSILQDVTNKESDIVLATIERMIYLKQSAFFKSLSVDHLNALAKICDESFVKEGEVLFHQGDEGGALYIVVHGAIDIGLADDNGQMITLATYESGYAFGDMSLFDNSKRSADATARVDTLMLRLRRDPFMALTRQYPDLSVHLITELSNRLRHANQQIAELNSSVRTNLLS